MISLTSTVRSSKFSCNRVRLTVVNIRINFTYQRLVFIRFSPVVIELFSSTWHTFLMTLASNTLCRISQRSKEISSGLSFGTFPSHANKEVFGSTSRTTIDLIAFIQQDAVVKQVICFLRTLIDGNQ